MRSPFYRAMEKMKLLGAVDFIAGKPITAFPGRNAKGIAAKFPDRSRAAYEMGWRGAKNDSEEAARILRMKPYGHPLNH